MTPHHQDATITLHHGDCLNILRDLPDQSVDSVVTDPPYNLSFMGKAWDAHANARAFQSWCELWATECLRVLKPGGHLLAFGGTRTYHRLACAIEDAGFEIRDSIAWLYGSGFPKNLDVSKAIDKAAGVEREVIGVDQAARGRSTAPSSLAASPFSTNGLMRWGSEWYPGDELPPQGRAYYDAQAARGGEITAPATDAARQWQGWGTALKPAFEPVVVARKPLTGTVAANVQAWGTGALNVDACRIGTAKNVPASPNGTTGAHGIYGGGFHALADRSGMDPNVGRWPANVVLDESQAAALDQMSGERPSGSAVQGTEPSRTGESGIYGRHERVPFKAHTDTGGASRFYYTAKADAGERVRVNGTAHPTVKPLALMRWLVRLVTPPGGVVLEPFAGSGTTVEACILENFRCIAIEREADYLPLIVQRVNRQRDPIAYTAAAGEDLGLFTLDLDGFSA